MFISPTVFLLGAGASWHYGYPTGEELVKKIIPKAANLQKYLEFLERTNNDLLPTFITDMGAPDTPIKKKLHSALNDCTALKTRLEQVNPLVIDYFLGWNPKLQSVGRLLIAWVILECEQRYEKNHGNANRREALLNSPLEPDRIRANNISLQKYKDNWCRFLIHQIAIDCNSSADILKNAVRFVTFNYDISLERALSNGLSHIELFHREDIETFLTNDRIIHVYGKVRESTFESSHKLEWLRESLETQNASWQRLAEYKHFLDQLYGSSRGIRVIDPDDKAAEQALVQSATNAIENARHVYILGYGFDENNSVRLRLRDSLDSNKPTRLSVSFTNYGNVNRINKRASNLFFGNVARFSSNAPQVEFGNQTYYEKSHRDVYEALELDFDLPSR